MARNGYTSILALDTAMNGCSAAIYIAGGESYVETRPMTRGQSEELVPMIAAVLGRAGQDYKTIDAVVTTLGPGAFTGLRIGLSTAKTLGLVLEVPVFGISTLQVLAIQYARAYKPERDIMVLVETKRADFYAQIFDAQGSIKSEARAVSAGDVALLARGKELVFTGDAVSRFRDYISAEGGLEAGWVFDETSLLPSPALMAAILAEQGPRSPLLSRQLEPLYLRAPDVSQPKNPPRAIA